MPVDARVTVCVAVESTSTLPKFRLPAPSVRIDDTAFNCSAKLCASPATLAVNSAICVVLTAVTVAVKLALVAPCATVTVAGTVTALLLLPRSMVTPPAPAAEPSVTVHASVVEPVAEPLAQLSELRGAEPVAVVPAPVMATTNEPPTEASLVISKLPVAAPVALGLNWTVNPKLLPGLTLAGRLLWLLAVKSCPVTLICEIVTAAVP